MSATLLPKHVAAVLRQQKDHLKALEMFNKVKREDGFKHNLLTYKCIIQKLGFHGNFVAMENVLAEMRMDIDNSFLEGVYIGAMKSYGRKGKVQEAVDVFERMDFYNCEPSVLSYNAIMNILVESGYFKEAHKVFLRMKNAGIVPDVYTFTIRIKSFCRTKRPHAALRLLNNMVSRECQLNAVSYCTVVAGFYEEDYRVEAYELFNDMLRIGIFPDICTFNKLLHTLCKKGEVQESEKLLNKVLKKGMCPNLFTFNIFIQGLCRKGMLSGAMSMFDSVIREGLTPDVVTYNTLIRGLCKNSNAVEAQKYLHKLVNGGLEPDGFTYNTMIDGYCKLGMIQNAEKILQGAICKGFVPDEFTYCSLINGLCQNDEIDRALALFNAALGKGLKPPRDPIQHAN
uniref:Pentacotripeptide-repeat region of PRORP domain-containing protein n=1 Tax=Salix viminalis TaxID=40686 RepID=A0A6N2MGX0_SALVM